jgi:hypothetical protein
MLGHRDAAGAERGAEAVEVTAVPDLYVKNAVKCEKGLTYAFRMVKLRV